jgi:hypothetical protein
MEPEGSVLCSQDPSIGPYHEPDQSIPPHPISLRSILILSSYLRLGIPSGLFPLGFPTKILYIILLLLHACHMPCQSHPPSLDHSNYTWWRVQVMTDAFFYLFWEVCLKCPSYSCCADFSCIIYAPLLFGKYIMFLFLHIIKAALLKWQWERIHIVFFWVMTPSRDQAGWCSSNVPDLYSGDVWFRSQLWYIV